MKPRSEIVKSLFNAAVAGVAGYLLAVLFGRGLASPQSTMVENFAHYENVRLPIGARSGYELKSFIVRLKGDVDDFGRVYVNNRQVTSNETPGRPFQYI